MKILIIGSKGFIGSHCVQYFSNSENDVWQCDVIANYDIPKYFYIVDPEKSFHDLFSAEKFDICINCSGAANVGFSLKKPLYDFQLNSCNVMRILDAIKLYNPECKYINLSSAAVYGNPQKLPINENHPLNPISPYGYHKVFAEQICKEFHTFYSLKVCCIRIFSAYGPGLRKQLLWDIAQKANESSSITLYGTGKETRDFIFINDLVKLIKCVIDNSSFEFDIVNAANGEQVSISKIAELMKNAISNDIKVEFNKIIKEGDPLNWEADISKAKDYGYKKGVSIEEGVLEYVKWLNQNK